MQLTIVLRKKVPNEESAQNLLDYVRSKLAEYPDVTVKGQVSDDLDHKPES